MEPCLGIGLCWFLVIGLLFFAQHHVCDAYFVPAINVFIRTMRASESKALQRWGEEAVAGATICALGCNGPELFANLISLYTGSDAGIGVVVGSEIFNLLCIIGFATLAAPRSPLKLQRVPFARDCCFYFLSICLLYWALQDKSIEAHEAFTLLGAAVLYVTAVYFTSDVVKAVPFLHATADEKVPPNQCGRMHGVAVTVEEIIHSRMADSRGAGQASEWVLDAAANGIYASSGDRESNEGENGGGALSRMNSIGFQLQPPDSLLGPVLLYKDLKEVVLVEMGIILLEFRQGLKRITLKVTAESPGQRDELLANIQANSLGRPWVRGYDATVVGAFSHFKHTMLSDDSGAVGKLVAFPELLIDVLLKSTLFAVDVKDVKKEKRWAFCFFGAMCWLAFFSFCMLTVADEIHYNIPILPSSFLGITVCAVGTSFPNAVASIMMAQQDKPAAAIANALGSNVQNVFLAMALPWTIFSVQHNLQAIPQNVAGINEGVVWMMGTLILVLFFVFLPAPCTLRISHGLVLVSFYGLYLVICSGETFGWWPPLIK